MNCIVHTFKHKQALQHYNLKKNIKIKACALLIAVEGMSYCILEAKYYEKFIYLKYCGQNLKLLHRANNFLIY